MKNFNYILTLLGITRSELFKLFFEEGIDKINDVFPVGNIVIKRGKNNYDHLLNWSPCDSPFTYQGSLLQLNFIPCKLIDGKFVDDENDINFDYSFKSDDCYIFENWEIIRIDE